MSPTTRSTDTTLFDADDLASRLEALDEPAIHGLPFGVIRIDTQGEVVLYSDTEARQSGMGERPVVGLDFFRSVAPCMNTDSFRGRIDRQLAEGRLDVEIGHTGDFDDRQRLLRVRALSATGGGIWLAIQR